MVKRNVALASRSRNLSRHGDGGAFREAVRITDRGPIVRGRCINLNRGAPRAIGMGGLARVKAR